jgi:Raf kinase inhibitor-like YbhB/YbcL family protein
MKNLLFYILAFSLAACASQPTPTPPPATSLPEVTEIPTEVPTTTEASVEVTEEAVMPFEISSPAFGNGDVIPVKFSCDGDDVSPALTWTEPPAGTQSFALIMDDPDAPIGTWVHWVVYNIPAATRELEENMPTTSELSNGIRQGYTSAKSTGYHGPCPPSGTHRYFFKLYALETTLSLSEKADKKELLAAMEGHILASVELMGTFSH